ncbi:MAG: hypothetical protein CM15mP83_5430 [Flavobacteriaceae bacterium]|nr:MAG: hypothetical protein CM15mP83_5430 [Flavobacteriaceae bacterium]
MFEKQVLEESIDMLIWKVSKILNCRKHYKTNGNIVQASVVQSKSLDEIQRMALDKEVLLSAIPSIQPINNEDLRRMASGYGWRTDPFTKTRRKHKGMDFQRLPAHQSMQQAMGKSFELMGVLLAMENTFVLIMALAMLPFMRTLSKYNVDVVKKSNEVM